MEFEGTATQAAEETSVDTTTTDTTNDGGNNVVEMPTPSTIGDMYETGDVKLPPPTATAHRGTLTAITRVDAANTGSIAIKQTFVSESNGMTYERTTWLPKPFADNVHITRAELEEMGTPAGKKQSYLQRFGETIHNSLNDAEIDQIIVAATTVGRQLFTKGSYTNLDEYIAKLSELAVNTPVIFTTRVEESEGYRPKLLVSRVFPHTHDTSKFRQKFADEV